MHQQKIYQISNPKSKSVHCN